MENIPNQNTPDANETNPEVKPEQLKEEFTGFMSNLKKFIREILDIREKTDVENTKKMIRDDIPFKGHTAWVLVCSIMIASIGLNANSAPVVIGAMLISPLMGPILGIGMSVAINDIDTLNRSLKNFGVMVVLSVLTAFVFFWIFPLKEDSSELISRTAPDVRDVLIAFFGGLALIIARTKQGTIASVIFGVAIATALMPPLCTAGYGLATQKFSYFFGAMYLFVINTIFIALATFLVLKILRFPMVRYANSIKRKRIAQVVSVIAFLVMIPAMYTFYNVFQKSLFNTQAKRFIDDVIMPYEMPEGAIFAASMTEIKYEKGGGNIDLYFIGNDVVPGNVEASWRNIKNSGREYFKLRDAQLNIHDGIRSESDRQLEYIQDLYERNKSDLANREERIMLLEEEVSRLRVLETEQLPIQEIVEEATINYENLQELSYYQLLKSNLKTMDTIPFFEVKWKAGVADTVLAKEQGRLSKWLAYKMEKDSVKIMIQ